MVLSPSDIIKCEQQSTIWVVGKLLVGLLLLIYFSLVMGVLPSWSSAAPGQRLAIVITVIAIIASIIYIIYQALQINKCHQYKHQKEEAQKEQGIELQEEPKKK